MIINVRLMVINVDILNIVILNINLTLIIKIILTIYLASVCFTMQIYDKSSPRTICFNKQNDCFNKLGEGAPSPSYHITTAVPLHVTISMEPLSPTVS